jgi:hypothetical protein
MCLEVLLLEIENLSNETHTSKNIRSDSTAAIAGEEKTALTKYYHIDVLLLIKLFCNLPILLSILQGNSVRRTRTAVIYATDEAH